MDSVMPNMNGLQAASKIRAMGYTKPIIGITGNTLPEQIQEFISHGADNVIQKPVNFKILEKIISGMFNLL
jgi:osomolarity two-component system response regulator SKN7